jgi:hypothetical protein
MAVFDGVAGRIGQVGGVGRKASAAIDGEDAIRGGIRNVEDQVFKPDVVGRDIGARADPR